MAEPVPMSSPDLTAADIAAVNQVLATRHLSLGPRLEAFEEAVASYVGVPHAVAVSSGTSGLHLCVIAAGIGEGDLVITFNKDRPGVIGEVGSIFGTLGINIASMTFGRKLDTQEACLALTLDAVPPPNLLEELRGKDFMQRVHHVSLPPLVTESE